MLLAPEAGSQQTPPTTTPAPNTQAPVCPQTHRCKHLFHVAPSTMPGRHRSFDSKELFPQEQLAIRITYAPHLPTDTELRLEPIGDCGLHFYVNGRFNGVATRCGNGLLPLHVQVANVNQKRLRLAVVYWVPAPLFTG